MKKPLLWLLQQSKIYLLLKLLYSGLGHILIFHRVCPDDRIDQSFWCKGLEVTPAYLETIIKYFLDQKYEPISLDQLTLILQRKMSDKKYVVFTFDDGYIDNYIYAYPIFRKYNVPFTIYITTGFVDRQAIMWWYSLSDFIFNNNHVNFELDNKTFEFDCTTNEAKEETFLNIRSLIRNCEGKDCLERIKKIFSSCKIDLYRKTDELSLAWDQIKRLNDDPLVTIGAHTVNHPLLNKLSRTAVKEEMLGSKIRLQSQLSREVKHFSYPFGARGEAEKKEFEISKECGFVTAATTRSANIFPAHSHHLQSLPRFNMGEKIDAQKLAFLISGLTHCLQNKFKRVVTL